MPRHSTHVVPQGMLSTVRHYIGDLVYGANDGVVTTFAAVAGAEGGALTAVTVLIIGVANLVADGLSMGIGNYLAIRSREQAREAEGLSEEESQPVRHGLATFLAFVVAGGVPLIPYAFADSQAVARSISSGLTLATLFGIGAARGVVTRHPWWKAGAEVLILGAVAGAAAYGAGAFIAHLVRG